MESYIGIDIGNKSSNICVVDIKGKIAFESRCATTNGEFKKVLKKWKGARCVVEASPLAEKLCEWVEKAGCRIEILDPRHAKAVTQTKKKTDKIDAQKLAQLCRMQWYQVVHRKSGEARELRTYLQSRHQLVKTAVALANAIKGLLRANGIVLPRGTGEVFMQNVTTALKDVPTLVQDAVLPLLKLWQETHKQQRRMYNVLKKLALKNETTRLLTSAEGVGAATAVAFYATVDDPARFATGEHLASALGLVPRVYQSGDTEFRGRITKQGDPLLRWLLTEAANSLLVHCQSSSKLREWGLKLRKEKGLAKARVAVARKLACILLAMWKNNRGYAQYVAA